MTAVLEHLIDNKKITFIGGGNMARSLINGLLMDNNQVQICVADPDESQLDGIRQNWANVITTSNNLEAIDQVDVVILAVKPQIMSEVLKPLVTIAQQQKPLFISIAAGITEANITDILGAKIPIVRCMPNTPALVQTGATGLYANQYVSVEQHELAESIMRAVGITVWMQEESLLDAVTAVSGSGPAYFFLVMEAMQTTAEKLGLPAEEAKLLILQTALGAAKLALESRDKPAELRKKVTSKGGTTEAALAKLIDGGLPELFDTALQAADQRAKELAK